MNNKARRIRFDYHGLKAKIRQRGMTVRELAEALGVSDNLLWRKLSGAVRFNAEDIYRIGKALSLQPEEIGGLFFAVFESESEAET